MRLLLAGLTFLATAVAVAQAPGDTVLWSFNPSNYAKFAPTVDASGNAYGVIETEGAHDRGYVWEFTASGQFKDLYDFKGPEGEGPTGTVAVDAAGNVYGTTFGGGAYSAGVVFRISPNGGFTSLASFNPATIGADPSYGVVMDANGDLFGTCSSGQNDANDFHGSFWELPNGGTLTSLLQFDRLDPVGDGPSAPLTIDASGNLYGSTDGGGTYGFGTVWRWNAAKGFSVVYEIRSSDAMDNPVDGAAADKVGNVYIVLPTGGANGVGELLRVAPNGTTSDIHDFTPAMDGPQNPTRVAIDAKGVVYGYSLGPSSRLGYVWTAYADGAWEPFFEFGSTPGDGSNPSDAPTLFANQVLFGVNDGGGAHNSGTLWSFRLPVAVASLSIDPGTVVGGFSAIATATLAKPAPMDTRLAIVSQNGPASASSSVTIPAGRLSATFPIVTQPVGANSQVYFGVVGGGLENFAEAPLVITAPTVTGLTLSATTLIGGASTTGTVTVSSPAPATGLNVSIVSEYSVATVPATVTIPAGQTTGTFTIATNPVATTSATTIAAIYGSSHAVAGLTISPPTLVSITLASGTLGGGSSTTATVTIGSAAPAAGLVITLEPNDLAVSIPKSVTVPAGATTVTFTVSTVVVKTTQLVTIKAISNGQVASTTLTITPS